MSDRKRRQIIEMWNRGKRVSKIARELRISADEVTEVINDLYSNVGINMQRMREVFKYDHCY